MTLFLCPKVVYSQMLTHVLGMTSVIRESGYFYGKSCYVSWVNQHLFFSLEESIRKITADYVFDSCIHLNNHLKIKDRFRYHLIKELLNNVDDVVILTRPNTMDEVVMRTLLQLCHCPHPIKSVSLVALDEVSVAALLSKPRHVKRVSSIIRRASPDYLIDELFSRYLTGLRNRQNIPVQTAYENTLARRLNYHNAFILANIFNGNVMTPAMLVRHFHTRISLEVEAGEARHFHVTPVENPGAPFPEDVAQHIHQLMDERHTFTADFLCVREVIEPPPRLLTLTDLIRQCEPLGMTAREVEDILMSLFEVPLSLISFPAAETSELTIRRFSSDDLPVEILNGGYGRYLSDDVFDAERSMVIKIDDPLIITPTSRFPDPEQMTEKQQIVYSMILKRFYAQFCNAHRYREISYRVTIQDLEFIASEHVITEAGWKAMYNNAETAYSVMPSVMTRVTSTARITDVELIEAEDSQYEENTIGWLMHRFHTMFSHAALDLPEVNHNHLSRAMHTLYKALKKMTTSELIFIKNGVLEVNKQVKKLVPDVNDQMLAPKQYLHWINKAERVRQGMEAPDWLMHKFNDFLIRG